MTKRTIPLITILSLCSWILAACSAPTPAPTATPPPAPSPTPTATIVWFPATPTSTASPALPPTSTPDNRPGLSSQIISDTFDQPALWDTSSSPQASAMVSLNKLVLSVNQTGPLSIVSLRAKPAEGDFYAEASAYISLCGDKDQYGMLFRAAGSQDYYRFTLNCNGQERLERERAGVIYTLLDWLASDDIPRGGPAQVKLGVWAVGKEMRLFLNDHFQFSATDPVFSSGTFGFFAYANAKDPITISFSDFSVYSISYIPPSPTPLPAGTKPPEATRTP